MKRQKKKLLGHVLKAEDSDPLRQVSFKPGTAREIEAEKRRVGNPRISWQSSAKKTNLSIFNKYGLAYSRKITLITRAKRQGSDAGRNVVQ